MAKVAEQTGLTASFVGADLQAEGLTINKLVTIDQHDQPAETVLRELLRKADPQGKLVYVIRRDGSDEKIAEKIEVTTRRGAAKRGHRLPLELRLPLAEQLKQPVAFHTEGKQPIGEVLEQFRRDMHIEVLVRSDDLPAADDQPRRAELDAEKMPASEVLRTLLTSAYGDAAIYVLGDAAGEECLIVTTREAAAKRGDKVPAEFAPPKP